jgi:hypothetical protein
MHYEEVQITPQLSKDWLERNSTNRHLYLSTVYKYARDMAAGRWLFTAAPIAFDADGNLVDGQHRLAAIIEAQVMLRMLVVSGLSPRARGYIDLGKPRGAGDELQMAGFPHAMLLAAVARIVCRYDVGVLWEGNYKPSSPEIRAWIDSNPHAKRSAEVGAMSGRQVAAPPSVVGGAYHICARRTAHRRAGPV